MSSPETPLMPGSSEAVAPAGAAQGHAGSAGAMSVGAGSAKAPAKGAGHEQHHETPKETIISVIISFALVFVFTRFVAASYVIPTGSMAPTLMGAHLRFWSDETGDNWAVNPWQYGDSAGHEPTPVQNDVRGGSVRPIVVMDDITGQGTRPQSNMALKSGDRIFVLNYLDKIVAPKRWDVVVFKFPGDAKENYIKRLVGLPGEEVWLADGDVFTRPAAGDAGASGAGLAKGWQIQRKSDRVQRALWYTLYSSEMRPLNTQANGRVWKDRWVGEGWKAEGLTYHHDSADAATLRWDASARSIDDWVAYNDCPVLGPRVHRYPVSDLRMRAGVVADASGLSMRATIAARGYQFQGLIENGVAKLLMRPDGPGDGPWTELGQAAVKAFAPGKMTDVEFWHADQSLSLWIGGEKVVQGDYNWGPQERLANVLGRAFTPGMQVQFERQYRMPQVSWTFAGSPVTLHRVGLDRDTYYQPSLGGQTLARGEWPDRPLRLGEDQFFVLGDNSAASLDGRAWESVDPWVAEAVDDTPGIVPRELMLGKAFTVFWPSWHVGSGPVPAPDFGRMRWIR